MKIIRNINGIEYHLELTSAELTNAYREKLHDIDVADIYAALAEMDVAEEGMWDSTTVEHLANEKRRLVETRQDWLNACELVIGRMLALI